MKIHEDVICAHCGRPQRGSANINGTPVCHTDERAYADCFRLVTVYGERLGSRQAIPSTSIEGRWLTPAEIGELVDEAERGYDVGYLRACPDRRAQG